MFLSHMARTSQLGGKILFASLQLHDELANTLYLKEEGSHSLYFIRIFQEEYA